jgi:HD-like signal output (HDOD) protein
MLLGIGEISNIVTALSLANIVKGGDIKEFNFMEFWSHSMIVGSASKDIAKRLGFHEVAGDAFVAGMLHDVGVQLIARYFPEKFKNIIELSGNGNMKFYDAEMKVLGLTHEDIGHYMVSKWNLPGNLADVLGYHHYPSKNGKDNITLSIVHLADSMTRIFEIGNFKWDSEIEFDESIITTLGFGDQAELEDFIDEYQEVFEDTADTMEL